MFSIVQASLPKSSKNFYKAWLKDNRKLDLDSYRASPKGAAAEAWVVKYFANKTATFAINMYTAELASAFALYWCDRMEYFIGIYQAQDSCTYQYTESDIGGAPKPSKILEVIDSLPLDHPAHARLDA